ncbi:MAG: NAD(P)/FAD-dependent oxidoreductase [Desulfobacula sp.]|uniref:phytoene desaturase family protein n=1 Tax=Desulfobacula sp. TaxID=2593537 RepID=UPI0025C334C2|nr:NAD(P)/FAD-dependent oxidoreductase [Desulfobacula sp.]MCD4719335.1 NAD(P)/FAD-dependent oxidoreductase [Desulfobacula sp.]
MESSDKLNRRNFLKTLLMASSAAAIDWTGFGALASSIPNKKNFSIIVIGAGLGGLVSAAYLSRHGFDVTLMEQHSIPGGYATSFDREDFTFDVSLHATVAEHAMPQMILSDLGIWDKLKVAYTPELKRIVTPDFDVTLPAKNPEGVKKALSKAFPHEKQGIYNFYTEMEQVISELWDGKRFTTSMMGKLEKISLEQWMSLHVKDLKVKYCMAIFSGYYGLSPSKINALFYAIATGEYLVHGGQYYKTRSQDLSDTLADCVEKNNGKIHYNTEVSQILFNDQNSIEGVMDSTGKKYPAKAVIANCSVPALFNKMVPKKYVPPDFTRQIQKRNTSLSSFVVWLGLNKRLNHIKDYEIDFALNTSMNEDQLFSKKDLADSNIGITIYDNLFKDYSAPGKSTLSIMCLSDFTPWKKFEKDYFNNQKHAYNREKERIAQSFIQRVEQRLIPGLSDYIEVMEIGTPLTNMFYTKNPEGAIYGFDRDMAHLKAKTPIRGLYLASAWSHGGGYTPVMMAGRETAKLVLKDLKTVL